MDWQVQLELAFLEWTCTVDDGVLRFTCISTYLSTYSVRYHSVPVRVVGETLHAQRTK